jgi:hypothetical protein
LRWPNNWTGCALLGGWWGIGEDQWFVSHQDFTIGTSFDHGQSGFKLCQSAHFLLGRRQGALLYMNRVGEFSVRTGVLDMFVGHEGQRFFLAKPHAWQLLQTFRVFEFVAA